MINSYPVGSVVLCRFAIVSAPLTTAQLQAFLAGNGLPDGLGIDPYQVLFDFQPPTGDVQTLTGDNVIMDATGAFNASVPVTEPGSWYYRGYGQTSGGDPVASTPTVRFNGIPSFPGRT